MFRRVIIMCFLILLISPTTGMLWGINGKLAENRKLISAVSISLSDLKKPSFYKTVENYFNDHFVFRAPLIKAKSWVDYNVFRTAVTTKVHMGTNGWLFFNEELPDFLKNACHAKDEIWALAKQIHELERIIESRGKQFLLVIPPNKSTIYPEHVGIRRSGCGKSRYDLLLESFREYPVKNFIRLDDILLKRRNEYEVFYKTDTHWNHYAAAIAIQSILKQLAPDRWNEYYPEIEFTQTEHIGDLNKMLAFNSTETTMAIKTIDYHSEITVEDRQPLENGLPSLRITTKSSGPVPRLPRMIIFRDSFMNSPLAIIKGCCTQIDVYWTYNMLHPEAVEDLQSSEIVLLEIVERNLGNLKFDLPGLKAILGSVPRTNPDS